MSEQQFHNTNNNNNKHTYEKNKRIYTENKAKKDTKDGNKNKQKKNHFNSLESFYFEIFRSNSVSIFR